MTTANTHRVELNKLKEKELKLRKEHSAAQASASKAREESSKKITAASKSTSTNSTMSLLRASETFEKKAMDFDKKANDIYAKIIQNEKEQAKRQNSLSIAEKQENKEKQSSAKKSMEREKQHAREISRIKSPVYRFVQIKTPEKEKLRILFLSANSDLTLYVDREARQVKQAIQMSKHRDQIDFNQKPAATYQDLLDGLNEFVPHIVHFSGHGGDESLCFDTGNLNTNEYHHISFQVLLNALSAVDNPPVVLFMNACDTSIGVEQLLQTVPVVVSMAKPVDDLNAIYFSGQFYSAIASGQSIASAMRQGAAKLSSISDNENDLEIPEISKRGDIDLQNLILVKP